MYSRTLGFVVANYVRTRNFVVAKIIVVFKNLKNCVIAKTLETHPIRISIQNFDAAKLFKNKKNVLLNRTLGFVVANYVRMQNFVVAKIVVVFKNPKNRVITETLETHLTYAFRISML